MLKGLKKIWIYYKAFYMIKIRFHVFKTRTVYIILLFCNVYSGMIWEELSELNFSTSFYTLAVGGLLHTGAHFWGKAVLRPNSPTIRPK